MGFNDHSIGAYKPHKGGAQEPTAYGDYLLLERQSADRLSESFTAKAFGAVCAGMLVTVKRYQQFISESEPEASEFLDALGTEALLEHPNICQLLDFGYLEDHLYTVVEHVVGLDLDEVVREARQGRPIPWPVAVFIVIQLLRALEAAHEQGPEPVVHKFLTPSHAAIGHDGRVRVRGFSSDLKFGWTLT